MSIRPTAAAFLLIVVVGVCRAEEAPTRVAQLEVAQKKYHATLDEKVDGAFRSDLGKLTGQLDLALSREEEKAIQAGNLDLVTAIQAERKRLVEHGVVSAVEHDAEAPVLLKNFRQSWRKEKAQLERRRAAAARALTVQFATELEMLEKSLTQERKIEEALVVRRHREKVAKSLEAMVASESTKAGAHGATGWITILDGADLKGWKANKPAAFQKVAGGIRAGKPAGSKGGLLFYVGDDEAPDIFGSFEIRMRLYADSTEGSANSGFFYHLSSSAVDARDNWAKSHGGFEINIANGDNLKNQTGSIWDVANVKRSLPDQHEAFDLVIRVTPDEIRVVADGREIMRHDPSSGAKKAYKPEGGAIALQSNSTKPAYVFEKIQIRRLR